MSETIYLINPYTGSVDAKVNWLSDMKNWEFDDPESPSPQQQFDMLIDVKKDENGEWQAV